MDKPDNREEGQVGVDLVALRLVPAEEGEYGVGRQAHQASNTRRYCIRQQYIYNPSSGSPRFR